MNRAIENIITRQGWNDSTLKGLLYEFIEGHDLVPNLVDYLADVAEAEDFDSEFDWDEDEDEDEELEDEP